MAAVGTSRSRCILFDVVVVHSVIHFKTLQFPKWLERFLQESKNSNKGHLWQQQERQAVVCT